MKHFLLIICLIVSSAQTCSAFQRVSETIDCMCRNSWIFGKVLYNCYGEDSVRSWLLNDNRFVMFFYLDENGDISDIRRIIRNVKREGGEGRVYKTVDDIISTDSIKKYLVDNGISFELCLDPSTYFPETYLDTLLNMKEERFNVGFPGLCGFSTDPKERTEVIIESLKRPFYFLTYSLEKIHEKNKQLSDISPEEYNKCLLVTSLLNALGDVKIFRSCREGLDLTVSLDLSPNHIPIAGNIQTSNIDLGDKDILLQRLLDIWQIFQIKFKPEPDQPASRLSISLKIKISDYPEFEEHLGKCKQISFIEPNP